MRDIRKRILAWVLTVAMVMGLIPSTAFADSTSNVFMMPQSTRELVADASGKISGVLPAQLNKDKTSLKVLSGKAYEISAKEIINEPISLNNSTALSVTDAPVALGGNLYYYSQKNPAADVEIKDFVEVDYLMLSKTGADQLS